MTAAGVALAAVSGLAAAGVAGTGWRAARLWLAASAVQPDPGWTFGHPEPVIPELRQMDWTVAMLSANRDGGGLNARAARWTAVVTALTATQSVAGFLASALA